MWKVPPRTTARGDAGFKMWLQLSEQGPLTAPEPSDTDRGWNTAHLRGGGREAFELISMKMTLPGDVQCATCRAVYGRLGRAFLPFSGMKQRRGVWKSSFA